MRPDLDQGLGGDANSRVQLPNRVERLTSQDIENNPMQSSLAVAGLSERSLENILTHRANRLQQTILAPLPSQARSRSAGGAIDRPSSIFRA
jgi:hypothetical protein